MKKITRLVVLITTLCCVFSMNAQVRLVKDVLPPANQSSVPRGFFEFGGRLFFSASYQTGIPQLFVSDGTTAGTIEVTNNAAPAQPPFAESISGNPVQHVIIDGELFFEKRLLTSNSQLKYQIWKVIAGSSNAVVSTNGANAFFGLTSFEDRFYQPIALGTKIIFSPSISASTHSEPVFSSNGTSATILKNIASSGGSNPKDLTVFNNFGFFSADDQSSFGREIWRTDGTTGGTVMLADINSGSPSSNPDQFTTVGSDMVFAASNSATGRELYKTTGVTGNYTLVKDINPTGDSNPSSITQIGSNVYFTATNGTDGQELFKSNLTSAGTIQIKNINPTGDSNPSNFIQFGSNVYFTATNGTNGVELYVTNGSPNVAVLVKDINQGVGDSNPSNFVIYNGKLYFTAFDGTDYGLWSANGNSNGTVKIDMFPGGDEQVSGLFLFNDELFFSARTNTSIGIELHAYIDPALSVEDFDLNETSISLFPNPTSTYFEIESTEMISKVNVYSIQGQVVKSFEPQSHYDISDLSNGMYFVKIQANNSEVTKEIIKQ
jgi:ELWxxDGT repeat protein